MRKKRLHKFPSPERWVQLPHHLLKCPAWVTMSPLSKALLLHLWARHNGVNNGEISYSTREAAEIGISSSAAARGLNELIARGFLKVTREARFTTKTRLARTWTITAERVGEERSTKDYMRWSPPPEQRESRTRCRSRDTQCHQRDRGAAGATI
jgi:hypothetical protein